MKSFKLTLFVAMIVFLVGCAGPQRINIKEATPHSGVIKTVFTGDVFFEYVNCYGQDNGFGTVFNGDCIKYDLTVVGISKEKITLQYREYTKPVAGQYGGYRLDAPWLVKEGFTRELDYATEEAHIRYKSYSFKILELKGNSVSYYKESN